MKINRIFLSALTSTLILLVASLFSVNAGEQNTHDELLQFQSNEQEAQYYSVIAQLRCPKCENQSIADSDAGIAKDFRFVVYQKVLAGETEPAILDYMQKRYGDFVLYDPPVTPKNYILWFLPLLVFLLVIVALVFKVGKRQLPVDDESTNGSKGEG